MVADSLLFELEIRDEPAEIPRCPGNELAALEDHISFLAAPRTLFESRLLNDVRQFKAAVLAEDGRNDIVVLATKLAAVGYHIAIRTALGGGTGQECFRNLHHEFLIVTCDGDDIIVEPHFRAQFCISQATPDYVDMVQALPDEWVGGQTRIKPLVKLLCAQMAAAFTATQTACPPWRQQKSVISKWLPAKKRDRDISAGLASPRAGSSPTSTLSSPDSPTSPASAVNPWAISRPAAAKPTAWQIPAALQQLQPSRSAALSEDLGTPSPIDLQPQPFTDKGLRLEPQSSTKGFEVSPKAIAAADALARDSQAGARAQASGAGARTSDSRSAALPVGSAQGSAQELPPKLLPWQAEPGESRGSDKSLKGAPAASERRSGHSNVSLAPDLGLVRRSAPLLTKPARTELWQLPTIHTVKLGRAR